MKLDFVTLMTVMAANLFMISAALPLIMGRDVSRAARHVQASLLLRHAPDAVSDGFCAARLGGGGGRAYGTLPVGVDVRAIVDRALPA